MKWRRILVALQAFANLYEQVSKGRAVSTDGILLDVEGFISCWCRRM